MASEHATQPGGERLGFHVGGMDCASCAGKIETALSRLDGISDVEVNFATETLRLSRDLAGKTTASSGRLARWASR